MNRRLQVVLFSEIEKETVPNEQPVEVALCVHHQSTYEHMCINCDELLCASCLQEHRNHSITPICDMVFQFYSGKLKDLAGKVEAKVELLFFFKYPCRYLRALRPLRLVRPFPIV